MLVATNCIGDGCENTARLRCSEGYNIGGWRSDNLALQANHQNCLEPSRISVDNDDGYAHCACPLFGEINGFENGTQYRAKNQGASARTKRLKDSGDIVLYRRGVSVFICLGVPRKALLVAESGRYLIGS